ncbi:hypothetical protein PR048_010594 [Dryococelus australis]|uniref:Uncharacterized protein n=1 Tax=Dryococelus australis TaxID=614101 RepID=A0ABQ9I491_9NEOP|nr:hypothetical protein PR048_010594 [Dryococelus australis]
MSLPDSVSDQKPFCFWSLHSADAFLPGRRTGRVLGLLASRLGQPVSSPGGVTPMIFCPGESRRTLPLVGGFSRVHPALPFSRCSILTSHHQDLDVKSRPNIFTHPMNMEAAPECLKWGGGEKRETPEKTRLPVAPYGTITTCENPGTTPHGNRTRLAKSRGEQSNHYATAVSRIPLIQAEQSNHRSADGLADTGSSILTACFREFTSSCREPHMPTCVRGCRPADVGRTARLQGKYRRNNDGTQQTAPLLLQRTATFFVIALPPSPSPAFPLARQRYVSSGFYLLPHRLTGFDSQRIRCLVVPRGNRARRCCWPAGFLGHLPFHPPFHCGAAPCPPRFQPHRLSMPLRQEPPKSLPLTLHSLVASSYDKRIDGSYEKINCLGILEKTRRPAPSSSTFLHVRKFGSGPARNRARFDLIDCRGYRLLDGSFRCALHRAQHPGDPVSIKRARSTCLAHLTLRNGDGEPSRRTNKTEALVGPDTLPKVLVFRSGLTWRTVQGKKKCSEVRKRERWAGRNITSPGVVLFARNFREEFSRVAGTKRVRRCPATRRIEVIDWRCRTYISRFKSEIKSLTLRLIECAVCIVEVLRWSALDTQRRGSDKGDATLHIKCDIVSKREVPNRRAVFSSHCACLQDPQRWPYYFIGGECIGRFRAGPASSFCYALKTLHSALKRISNFSARGEVASWMIFSGNSRFPPPLHSGDSPYSLQSPSSPGVEAASREGVDGREGQQRCVDEGTPKAVTHSSEF